MELEFLNILVPFDFFTYPANYEYSIIGRKVSKQIRNVVISNQDVNFALFDHQIWLQSGNMFPTEHNGDILVFNFIIFLFDFTINCLGIVQGKRLNFKQISGKIIKSYNVPCDLTIISAPLCSSCSRHLAQYGYQGVSNRRLHILKWPQF